jgi:hypothetical protein
MKLASPNNKISSQIAQQNQRRLPSPATDFERKAGKTKTS